MSDLQKIIEVFDKELEKFEQQTNIQFDGKADIEIQRIAKVKAFAPYRQYLLKLFLQYKAEKYIQKNTPVTPADFLNKAKEFYKTVGEQRDNVGDEDLYTWLRSSNKARPFLKVQGIKKYQLDQLKKGKTVSEDKLSEIISVTVLLNSDLVKPEDAATLFVDLCTDSAVLQNFLDNDNFFNLLSRKAFTEGFIKLAKRDNAVSFESFVDQTKGRFEEQLSIKMLLQSQNIKMFSSRCVEHFFTAINFKDLLQKHIDTADRKELEVIYTNAPVELFPYMENIPRFVEFVKSNPLLSSSDIVQIFHSEFSDFKIKMHMKVWKLSDSFSVLTDSTDSGQKVKWLSKVHPIAFDEWMFDTNSALNKAVIGLNNPNDLMLMVEILHGGSIISMLKFFKENSVSLRLSEDSEDKARVVAMLCKKISSAQHHRTFMIEHLQEVISSHQEFIKSNNDDLDLKKEINEAMHRVISSGHIYIEDLFNILDSTGIISRTTRQKFDNRLATSNDVSHDDHPDVHIGANPSVMDDKPTDSRSNFQNTQHKNSDQKHIPLQADDICNNWFYVNTIGGILDIGGIGGGWLLGHNVHNVFAARHVGANVLAGAIQLPPPLWRAGIGIGASELLRQGYKWYYDLGYGCMPKHTVCPDTGFCSLPGDVQSEPIKCEVGKVVCPVVDLS